MRLVTTQSPFLWLKTNQAQSISSIEQMLITKLKNITRPSEIATLHIRLIKTIQSNSGESLMLCTKPVSMKQQYRHLLTHQSFLPLVISQQIALFNNSKDCARNQLSKMQLFLSMTHFAKCSTKSSSGTRPWEQIWRMSNGGLIRVGLILCLG